MRILILIAVVGFLSGTSFADSLETIETRYCGPPGRDIFGVITRSSRVIAAFRSMNPCPSTGMITGPCPGWSINHDYPRACGGCDSVANLSYMRNDVKKLHDSYERKIHGVLYQSKSCTAVPIGGIK